MHTVCMTYTVFMHVLEQNLIHKSKVFHLKSHFICPRWSSIGESHCKTSEGKKTVLNVSASQQKNGKIGRGKKR